MRALSTHDVLIDFGKHRGERLTRVPVSYLRWMVDSSLNAKHESGTPWVEYAKAEMERRGTVVPDIEISGHAIDTASLRIRKIWHETAMNEQEGLHAWLVRMAKEALERGTKGDDDAYFYHDIKWVFSFGECYPTLKTVMRKRSPCSSPVTN